MPILYLFFFTLVSLEFELILFLVRLLFFFFFSLAVFYAKIGGLVMLIIPYMFSFVRNWLTNLAFYLFCTNSFLEGLDVLQTFSNKRMYRVE